MSRWRRWWGALTLAALLVPPAVRAQYEEEGDRYAPSTARFGYAGVQFIDFAPRPGNPAADSLIINFKRLMPVIGFRQGTTDIQFGYTRYDQHGTSRPMIYIAAAVALDFPLTGPGKSMLVLPLLLSVDFTRAEASGEQRDDFNVGSLGIGTGLRYRLRGEGMEFNVAATAGAQISFEGFSGSGGSSVLVLGTALLHLYDVPVGDGIVVGYQFRYQSWSMSRAVENYRSLFHGPFLGVMF